jgi:hypothetical protein
MSHPEIREIDYPRYEPRLNRDYDPILRQWRHPPEPVLWHYTPKRKPPAALDTILGIIGIVIFGLGCVIYFLYPWA